MVRSINREDEKWLPAAEKWDEAHQHREALLEYITQCSGAGTLLDYRRYRDYDADKNVDRYLNQPEVKVMDAVSHALPEPCMRHRHRSSTTA